MVFYSRYYEFKENEAAFEIGKLFQNKIRELVDQDEMNAVQEHAFRLSTKVLPQYVKEIEDRAKGAGVSFNQMFNCIVGYDFNTRLQTAPDTEGHCTDIMIRRADGIILMGHNEDNYVTTEGTAVIKHITDDGWYVELALPDTLAGPTVMWNSKGIYFGCNALLGTEINTEYYPTLLVVRALVDCGSIEEIEEKVNQFPIMTDFSINILDKNKNEAYSLEIRQDQHSLVKLGNTFVHSNHFLHIPDYEKHNAAMHKVNANTGLRVKKASEMLSDIDLTQADYSDVSRVLAYRNTDNSDSIRKIFVPGTTESFTAYTVLCDSITGTVQVTDHMSKEQVVFLW